MVWTFLFLLLFPNQIHQKLVIHEQYEKASLISPACKHNREFYFYQGLAENQLRNHDKARSYLKSYVIWFGKEPATEGHLFIAERLLEQEKPDKMNDIAMDMNLVERKLRLAMGGPKTQEIQKSILKKLDDEIKSIEQQMQQQQESAMQQNGNKQSQVPAPDSQIIETPGKGEVANKNLVQSNEKWGNLPEKDKAKAIQELNKQLPDHIREAAEGYTKKLANGPK